MILESINLDVGGRITRVQKEDCQHVRPVDHAAHQGPRSKAKGLGLIGQGMLRFRRGTDGEIAMSHLTSVHSFR